MLTDNHIWHRFLETFTTPIRAERATCLRTPALWQCTLLLCITALALSSVLFFPRQTEVYAANPGPGKACTWHRVVAGDTLGRIAWNYRTTIWSLAQVNGIRNLNLIYTGQQLCIASPIGAAVDLNRGVQPNGSVGWYAYNSLGWSGRNQVAALIRQIAPTYGIPTNLMLAIAWQESAWNQHVIARDGGIGAMQLMPNTASGLNRQVGGHYNPYQLWGNLQLGAIYLHSLLLGFHWNLTRVISAYNEGGWSVIHRGIFNWRYVNAVRTLMTRY